MVLTSCESGIKVQGGDKASIRSFMDVLIGFATNVRKDFESVANISDY